MCRHDPQEDQVFFFDLAQLEKVHTKASSNIKRLGKSVSQRRMLRETENPPLTMIDEKPTDGTSTRKKAQDGHGTMESENFEGVLFSKDFSRQVLLRVSYTCSNNYSVYDGVCTHTHLSHAHNSGAHTLCTYFSHLHAYHTHSCLRCLKRFIAHLSYLTISHSPF